METEVRELIAKAAYHGISRKEVALQAGISHNSLSRWKHISPTFSCFKKAERALDELIEMRSAANEKVES